ncbi:PQQ-dependent sugar dehydrogenase [Antarcticimicrobium luteum]|uniref:PQQ-dependent sugar dehydrogenase n=1 Tax=Antarcticimicrobium luteum TaxID=2547397 RepID=A0A4R5V021_9RHOB|nr:PQQ-dependent sugar dehydrogenase [Antarcticimicrobium luteum]TDK45078.1 PQQ-dependent sugar dehydrogenase [Antarcticimicrobium luteum]
MRILGLILFCLMLPGAARADTMATSAGPVRVDEILTGLHTPWAIAFLPDGSYLVTERAGALLHVRDGRARRVTGVPQVAAIGQGGLLDVMVPRDFATSREVFLTYSRARPGGAGTALAVGRLSKDGAALSNVRILFEAAPGARGGRHFGSRVIEAADGRLFVTLGERGDRPSAQDRSTHNGSIVRINRDGSVPQDNPFAGEAGARPEIWSYGHRNPQGAALDRTGALWAVEHGAQGGDEVNRIRRGVNYGWPVIAYGRHYSGARIGEGTAKPGMAQPDFYWDPSIAPSGLMIYSGRLWPDWAGQFFVGSLKFDMISRLAGDPLREEERIAGAATARVRDVAEAPDGSIWVVSEGRGAVYRLTPMR